MNFGSLINLDHMPATTQKLLSRTLYLYAFIEFEFEFEFEFINNNNKQIQLQW